MAAGVRGGCLEIVFACEEHSAGFTKSVFARTDPSANEKTG